jgi:hypothetical protein
MVSDNDEFVSFPVRKLLNRENYFSRVERLERQAGAKPSATVNKLGEIGTGTGNLVVDSVVVPNRTDGVVDVTIDDLGVWFRNQEGRLAFEDTDGNVGTLKMYSDADNFIVISNQYDGKGISFLMDSTSGVPTQIDFDYTGITLLDGGIDIPTGQTYKINGQAAFTAGTYAPTITAVANVDSASASGDFIYQKISTVVSVAGTVNVDPTAAGVTTDVGISLPVASDFTAATDAAGTGGAQGNDDVASVIADATNNRAVLRFTAAGTVSAAFRLNFMYVVM